MAAADGALRHLAEGGLLNRLMPLSLLLPWSLPPVSAENTREPSFCTIRRPKAKRRKSAYGSHASATNVRKEDQLDAIDAPSIQETMVDSLADCRIKGQRNNVDSI
ncbi:hypothetical protein BKA61DRAFT_573504 [Leptodontidium sp. MPI-SDFR-AT-0119]|nr:hypothetical protein BKA61DRAFT_573504 [Leptodontidium sp. MPI-SDFR-AT-0119]